MKTTKALFGILVLTLGVFSQSQAQDQFTNGLVAYYPFNGNANDASGNGFHGIINGSVAPTENHNGQGNAAYLFPGSGDSYVHVSNFDENLVSNAVTMTFWFTFAGGSESPRVFNNYDLSRTVATTGSSSVRRMNYHKIGYTLQSPDLTEGNWYSITVVETLNGGKMFLNGQIVNEASFTSADIAFYGVFDIGRNVGGNEGWGGKLDEFRIYNRALSDSEVQQLYAYEFGPRVNLMKAVKPWFDNLTVSSNYQLQVSGDLNDWTNHGSAFTATNTSMIYPQYWDVDNWGKLFFRLQVAP